MPTKVFIITFIGISVELFKENISPPPPPLLKVAVFVAGGVIGIVVIPADELLLYSCSNPPNCPNAGVLKLTGTFPLRYTTLILVI